MGNKRFIVNIEFDDIEIIVNAKNKTEARKKALAKLSRKNSKSLIKKEWRTNRKKIDIEEY